MKEPLEIELKNVTRLEVINWTNKGESGRVFTYWSEYDNGIENPIFELDLQDGGKTLKIFIKEKAEHKDTKA